MIQNLTTKTVREIALEAPLTTRVFEHHRIDYCCGGQSLFLDACRRAGADAEDVLKEINDCLESGEATEIDWIRDASLGKIADYIVAKHHVYTEYEIKNLQPLMTKVATKHGGSHPKLFAMEQLFSRLCDELVPHMMKEERVLFPYVKELERFRTENGKAPLSCFGTVRNPVGAMMREHDAAGEILTKMRAAADDYRIPEGACPSLTALMTRLEALEKDLHRHIHLENNVLFPRAVELEDEVFAPQE